MILIVDDIKENIFSLRELLELNGYTVQTASSGEEALKMILKNEYFLIIMDVQMPGMDGYEVAEVLSGYSKTKEIPVIFLSAVNIDKKFITRGYSSGGVDYVTKPFDPEILLLKIKTFIRLYIQNKELNEMRTTLERKVEDRTKDLLESNQALELSNAELHQYAFLASHDLQEPVRKILTFSRIINEKLKEDPFGIKDYLTRIINSSERMRNLIDDLLNYSKLSAAASFRSADLNNILEDTLSDLELSIIETQTVVNIEKLETLDVMAGQMRQVFQNLLTNAMKFAVKDRQPVISIRGERVQDCHATSPVSADGKFYRILIRDNGIGFDEKYLEKIFGIFQRLHTRVEYEGTGIGLAIVRKIIEKHGGLITARSREGEGTEFIIVLPVKQEIKNLGE